MEKIASSLQNERLTRHSTWQVALRSATTLVLLVLGTVTMWAGGVPPRSPQSSDVTVAIYDENPSHLWNRLYAALRVREDSQGKKYGEDSLDPMLWRESEHLLAEPSHRFALRVLDQFLQTHADHLIQDPLKRAMLQRDLWAVFDWSVQQESQSGQAEYVKEKQELQIRLAEVLRRLALTQLQIKSLPDNYTRAVASAAFAAKYNPAQPGQTFLPPDLFDPHGQWVCIAPSDERIDGVAKLHVGSFSGRSVFLVFVRLPEGRHATLDYFQTLWNFPQPWVSAPGPPEISQLNPNLPSFPAGTQMALVRQMVLFDNERKLVISPITESVQIRVYREITTALRHASGMTRDSGQDYFEIKISRPLLFSGEQGGLRATPREESELPTFQTIGDDPIGEFRGTAHTSPIRTMQSCFICHSGGGIRSFESVESLLKPTRRQEEPQDIDYGPRFWNETSAVVWKKNQYDWGLLNGYWNATR